MSKYILALDQGTTSSRAILFNHEGQVHGCAQQEFRQIFSHPGWVEHDPNDIWQSQIDVARQVMLECGVDASEVAAIGITNQRETTVVWDRATGAAIGNAIVWQDRRTAGICDALREAGHAELFQRKTGLVLDAYFSGTKVRWLLDNVPGARARAERGELAFGTVDSWLISKLCGEHVTDTSNASRTLMFNIHTLSWDDELLEVLQIPRAMLPRVVASSEVVGHTDPQLLGRALPIAGIAGDQQAATFGQACMRSGMAKNTYGTGCFMLMNTGVNAITSHNNLVTTVGWTARTRARSTRLTCWKAACSWLARSCNGCVTDWASSRVLRCRSACRNGARYGWRGICASVCGPGRTALGRLCARNDSRHDPRHHQGAYRACRACQHCLSDSGHLGCNAERLGHPATGTESGRRRIEKRLADAIPGGCAGCAGGAPIVTETTALGAAYLAGIAVGFWHSQQEVAAQWRMERRFEPNMGEDERTQRLRQWHRAVERSRAWVE